MSPYCVIPAVLMRSYRFRIWPDADNLSFGTSQVQIPTKPAGDSDLKPATIPT